ncbi:MAG: hypothetical protein CVV52_03860 [Spirochaetae bacterium HGW-Spirochaetae-8]|jgi:hypothetical protein|nr:MAG: hypothetical protein CVV52_03860 [Spirochaetae bacterium HGW-Spirochaetae-8]
MQALGVTPLKQSQTTILPLAVSTTGHCQTFQSGSTCEILDIMGNRVDLERNRMEHIAGGGCKP